MDQGQSAGVQHHPKVEDALKYLEKVKNQFGDKPHVYDSFLDIMKDFKSQSIDTPGVIARVWDLFQGHKDLILGFNTFLPHGYKIEIDETGDQPPQLRAPAGVVVPPPASASSPPRSAPLGITVGAQGPMQRKQPKEFNHAINYVNKIKTRFQTQPQIYKAFLEILHTYQKEQRTIPEVYSEVAVLFRSHQDLLDEFSQFLPETVPDSAAAQPPVQPAAPATKRSKRQTTQSKRRAEPTVAARPAKRPKKGEEMDELCFFNTVKRSLSRSTYAEFLKCINLYTHQIIGQAELLGFMEDLIGDQADLMLWIKKFIGVAPPPKPRSDKELRSTMDLDYSHMKRSGASYRALPKNHVRPVCSGRDELCKSVLNDTWVSVPATEGDDFIFKSSMKNEYEERLFKCEDDRYELDMVIEHNLSTMRVLEALASKIAKMQQQGSQKLKLSDIGLGVIQVKAIERIYGDKAGDVLDGFKRNPHVAIPIVLKRLRQKDEEWKRIQREWVKVWNETNANNYQKSLDHKSVSFKTQDRKALGHRALVQDTRQMLLEEKEEGLPAKIHFSGTFANPAMFADVIALTSYAADNINALSDLDVKKMAEFLKTFVADCLAIRPIVENVQPHRRKTQVVDEEAAKNLPLPEPCTIFGGDAYYLFFRLLTVLYDRLSEAKTLAESAQPGHMGTSGVNQQSQEHTSGVAVALHLNKRAEPVPQDDDEDEDDDDETKAQKAEERANEMEANKSRPSSDVLYDNFIALLHSLISNRIDGARYEDECRDLFGTSAYRLFTLDRVISQLCKTLAGLVTDETCARLMALHNYERTRVRPVLGPYRAAAGAMLEDESLYQIVVGSKDGVRCVAMRLIDCDDLPPPDPALAAKGWATYVEDFIQPRLREGAEPSHTLFMKRNVRKGTLTDQLSNTTVHHALEGKICLQTFKLVYLENTEDFFYRKGKRGTYKGKSLEDLPIFNKYKK